MDGNVIIPAVTAVLAGVFAVMLLDQWRTRRRAYQAIWGLGGDIFREVEGDRVLHVELPIFALPALAQITESLAGTGVNIDAMYLLNANGDHLQFALAVNDPEAAAAHLSM